MPLVKVRAGLRYATNLTAMVARQRGYLEAAAVGSRFIATEAAKLPRAAELALKTRSRGELPGEHPPLISESIIDDMRGLGVDSPTYQVDVAAFRRHVAACGYPRYYAGGPLDEGGFREQKLLEYFVSLQLLAPRAEDVMIDIASEWSIFPEVARRLTGATVYRQDLIYPPGVHGDRIGGSAAKLPVPDDFADILVAHNAFEHFEGTADSDFIREAWRVLRPGGKLCILPLFVSDRPCDLTDPLTDRHGVVWDDEAQVVELPWWHNRFGRLYDASGVERRVLRPGNGFTQTIYHVTNAREVHPGVALYFALLMRKPAAN
jgi:SAM-dependent methyltransferase